MHIHNLDFAVHGQTLTGTLKSQDCPRLQEVLIADAPFTLDYQLAGNAKQYRHPSLTLKVKAGLPVACQRCLDVMQIELNLSFQYLIGTEAEMLEMDDEDETDWLEIDPKMDVIALIEDEILAAMPIAPTHAQMCGTNNMQSGEKLNPFAVLQTLKSKG